MDAHRNIDMEAEMGGKPPTGREPEAVTTAPFGATPNVGATPVPDMRPTPDAKSSMWTAGVIGIVTIAAIVWAISDVTSLPEQAPKIALESGAATAPGVAADSTAPSQHTPVAALAPSQAATPAPPAQASMPTAPRSAGPVTPVYRVAERPEHAMPGQAAAYAARPGPTTPVYGASERATSNAPVAAANAFAPRKAVARDTRVVTTRDTPARSVPERAARPVKAGTAANQRLANDARIRSGVLERLAANRATIYGRIGVESQDAVVRLTGYTQTSDQALRAEREARKVRGVRSVRNEIRPRIGGAR